MNVTEVDGDKKLARQNLNSATKRIKGAKSTPYSKKQGRELSRMLTSVFRAALPHFVKGRKHNPIHHNTQVLDNMVQIGLGENLTYREFRNAVLLALLHDIGNAVSQRPKFKTSQVIAALKKDVKKGTSVALKAIAFRLEHMDCGPELARDVLKPFVSRRELEDDDVHLICRAIAVHDYPTIEKLLKELDKTKTTVGYKPRYKRGDFLLAFDSSPFGRLIELLREADRLFMVSEQGVLKDLRDKDEEVTACNVLAKLKSNEDRHADEFKLYGRGRRAKGFKRETLYRTRTGYALFRAFAKSLRAKWNKQRQRTMQSS